MNRWWNSIGEWIDAADPGQVRRHHAVCVALAALTAWLAMRFVIGWLAGQPLPAVTLFAVTVCFISALVVVDPLPDERQVTLLLGIAMFMLGLLIACLLSGAGWAHSLLLLILIFASFAVRRWGLRPGELVLLLTMGLYFAENSRVAWSSLLWFGLAVVVGVGSLSLWQFAILPYDPQRLLRHTIRSYYDRVAAVVDDIAGGLEAALKDEAVWTHHLQRGLKQVKLSRRVIESQLPGVLAPGGLTGPQNSQLEVALFAAEQGLGQMIEGVSNQSHIARIPAKVHVSVTRSLRLLHVALLAGGADGMQTLAQESAVLQAEVRGYATSVVQTRRSDLDASLAPWVRNALLLAGGSHQVARSIAQVRALEANLGGAEPPVEAQSSSVNVAKLRGTGQPPRVRVLGRFNLHPTLALGIQAVTATGLAMLAARLLNLDHSNWVFWTAFVVIAGSTGESLRRMMMRVLATVAGAAIGVILAVLAPNDAMLVVVIATVCMFLTVFFTPASYPLMVFWLNIGFVLVYTLLGAQEFDLLFARPSTTLLGALVAALVVVYVFPIRITDRFKAAVARFLGAVDGYVAAFVAAMIQGGAEQTLAVAQAQVAAAYMVVEQTLPGVQFENNPLVQAESRLTEQATRIAALDAEVTRLSHVATEGGRLTADSGAADGLRAVQILIHRNIQAIMPLLRSENSTAPNAKMAEPELHTQQSVEPSIAAQADYSDLIQEDDDKQGQFQSSGGMVLLRIYGVINELAAELGATAKAAPAMETR